MTAPHPASVWRATAKPSPSFPRLEGDLDVEVAIVGGGFTGLQAARQLRHRSVSCAVIEAADIGWGASGRSGGFAVPRYKKGFAALAKAHGTEAMRHMHRLILDAVDTLDETVREFALDCLERNGHLTPAHSRTALDGLKADIECLAALGDRTPRLLSREETAEAIGTDAYRGAYLDPRGGNIHPYDYCRGLAAALAERGVPIHVETRAGPIRHEAGAVILPTPRGRIRAKRVIVATNAYTEDALGAGHLHRRVIPVASSVIATVPLPADIARTVCSARLPVSDTKHLMHYFRMLPNGQFLFGGRGDITGRRDDPSIYRGLETAMVELFPQLAGIGIAQRWAGMVAVTLDNFPHLGRLGDRVIFALGYGGRGVALTALLGKYAAAMARGETIDAGPMSASVFGPVPFHGLRIPGMRMMAFYYGLKDARARQEAL